MTSRRNFLKQGTLGSIAAGFTLGMGDKVAAHGALGTSPLGLNQRAFASQLDTTFMISDGSKRIPLRLIDVVDHGSKNTSNRKEAFTLVLRGNPSSPLKQATYSIEHQQLGGFSFLLVPVISRDKGARYYEININRLHG